MASSSSSEDKDSKRCCRRSCHRPQPPTDENPFVKFKRFADSQISNVLHGIFGLPSVFKASQMNSNRGGLDEKMKKREDEMRVKVVRIQRPTEGSETPKSVPGEIPNKWLAVESQNPEEEWKNILEGIFTDIPLYSTMDDLPEMDIEIVENMLYGGGSTQMHMNLMQDVISSKLHQIFTLRQILDLHGLNSSPSSAAPKSLLPYLMHSPYSPLRLTHLRRLHPRDSEGMPKDEFSYCDAFEDLLLASRGRPMRTWSSPTSGVHHQFLFEPVDILYPALRFIKPMWSSVDENNQYHRANTGFSWIRDALHSNGLFWENPEPLEQSDVRDTNVSKGREETESRPETEQDMYNHFLNLATSPLQRKPLPQSEIESLVGEMHKMIVEALDPPKETPSENATPASSKASTSISKSTQTDKVPAILTPTFPTPLAILLSSMMVPPPKPSSDDKFSASSYDSTWTATSSSSSTTLLPNGHTLEITVSHEECADGRVLSRQTETVRDGDRIVSSVSTDNVGHTSGWSEKKTPDEDAGRRDVIVLKAKRPEATKQNTRPTRGWFWDGGR